jgi:putative glutamine amidotransferase
MIWLYFELSCVSLYQDISTQVEGSLVHRNADEYEKNHHAISVQKDGLFSALYGRQPDALVNSVHHQGIKKLAPGLRVEAISPVDGIIEAISLPRSPDDLYPNCFAVQWHPEFQDDKNPSFLNSQVLLTYFMQLLARQAQESAPQQQRTIVHA